MIEKQRIHVENELPTANRKYVLYWMQQSQRAHYNHALEYAISEANKLNKPVVTVFGITDDFPEANLRHYYFMLEGLQDTKARLEKRGIQLVIQHKSPELLAAEFSKQACMVVMDCGFERIQRKWREHVVQAADCAVVEAESDTIVPVELAAQKEQYTAGVFRLKVTSRLDEFLTPVREGKVKQSSLGLEFKNCFEISDVDKAVKKLKVDTSVKPSQIYHGGTTRAIHILDEFIEAKLGHFHYHRNDPGKEYLSNMSPYLHFGQISPVYVALKIKNSAKAGKDSYLEELCVRRELSWNFVRYNSNYDNFEGLPTWAKNTLRLHAKDRRKPAYTLEELETAQTYDLYWNAAQTEMTLTGKMHGYMRMYWGKKILEWVKKPEEAYRIAIYLNNKYFIDGRDPNGYTGVAWCFGKHDRLWQRRPIFGQVRYMNAAGLKRKTRIDDYVARIERLKSELK